MSGVSKVLLADNEAFKGFLPGVVVFVYTIFEYLDFEYYVIMVIASINRSYYMTIFITYLVSAQDFSITIQPVTLASARRPSDLGLKHKSLADTGIKF